MIEIGKYNKLTVSKFVEFGLYLTDGEVEILLPQKYITEEMAIDSEQEVFVYKDAENRVIATTLIPKVTLDEFAALEVSQATEFGAFMEWGIPKELFVPHSEQSVPFEVGQKHVVFMYLDEKSNRLAASSKIDKFIRNTLFTVNEGDKVWIMVTKETPIGFSVIVNGRYKGLLYRNEVFRPLEIGDECAAYIKQIREDNKLDVTLNLISHKAIEPDAQKILDLINQNDGFLNVTDKSSPDEIYRLTHLSKKAFKRAVGSLYKGKIISLEKTGLQLLK